jgi:hypothetical protein
MRFKYLGGVSFTCSARNLYIHETFHFIAIMECIAHMFYYLLHGKEIGEFKLCAFMIVHCRYLVPSTFEGMHLN